MTGSSYFGKVLRIPGTGGGSFSHTTPKFSQQSAYESAMNSGGIPWITPFDTAVGCPCYLNIGLGCLYLLWGNNWNGTQVSPTQYFDCVPTLTYYPLVSAPAGMWPVGSVPVPDLAGTMQESFPTFILDNYNNNASFTGPVTSATTGRQLWPVSATAFAPGTLLPGNQWYITITWTAQGFSAQGAPACTGKFVFYLVDFSAGMSAAPVAVTALSTLATWAALSSSPILPGAGSVALAMGMTLPSPFLVTLGAEILSGGAHVTTTPNSSNGVIAFTSGTATGRVLNGYTVTLTQAP